MNLTDMKYYRSVAYKTEVFRTRSGSEELSFNDKGGYKHFNAWKKLGSWWLVFYVKHEGKRVAIIFEAFHTAEGVVWYLDECRYLHNNKRLRRVLETKLYIDLHSKGKYKSADVNDVHLRKTTDRIAGYDHQWYCRYHGYEFWLRKATGGGYWVMKKGELDYDVYWTLKDTIREAKVYIKTQVQKYIQTKEVERT